MFSQTVEYALRAVMLVAGADGTPVNSERISEQMRIPHAYLSKVMRGLVVGKILKSQLGPNGGFVMARDIDRVSVLDVVNAVDPLRRITSCPLGRADHVELCPLHREMDDAMHHVECRLKAVSIAELQERDSSNGPLALLSPVAVTRTVRRPTGGPRALRK
jgi:Rrf2 family protein